MLEMSPEQCDLLLSLFDLFIASKDLRFEVTCDPLLMPMSPSPDPPMTAPYEGVPPTAELSGMQQ